MTTAPGSTTAVAFTPFRIAYSRPGNISMRRLQRIPYTIFQTFKTRDVPATMFAAAESWIERNPEYDHEFFDDARIEGYLARQFPCAEFTFSREQLLRAFHKIRPGAGKADLFRYSIIYDKGGIYMDIDTTCRTPINSFLHPDDEVLSGIGGRGDFHQWGLMYVPGHPFMKQAIEMMVSNILHEQLIPGFHGLEAVGGPPCLDLAIKHVLNKPAGHRFAPGTACFTLHGHSYRYRLLDGDYFGHRVQFKYPEYLLDLQRTHTTYWAHDRLFNDHSE